MFFLVIWRSAVFSFFFFNDTATTEIYTLSLHDALPISGARGGEDHHPLELPDSRGGRVERVRRRPRREQLGRIPGGDRKSTRLNSSHGYISYAVFCLKKKKKTVIKHLTCSDHLPKDNNH